MNRMILLITSYQTFWICVAQSIFTCYKIQSSNDNILLAKKNACKQHWKMTIYDSLNTEFNGQHQRSILFWPQGNALYLYSDHMHDKSLKYSIICTEEMPHQRWLVLKPVLLHLRFKFIKSCILHTSNPI